MISSLSDSEKLTVPDTQFTSISKVTNTLQIDSLSDHYPVLAEMDFKV